MARAVIADGSDVVSGLVFIAFGKTLEDIALGVGDQVIGTAEDIGEVSHADRLVVAGREARSRDDDVDRPELEALVDVGFLAELRRRIDLDLVAPIGAFVDLFRGPDGIRVEGLGRFIDMRPFQHCLGLRDRATRHDRGCGAKYRCQSAFHCSLLPSLG
ncbi:hypothetical protein ACVIOG_006533 [Rhizobium leguminosarum]